MNVISHKTIIISSIAADIKTAPSKDAHVTKNLQSKLICFILRNAVAHGYKQTIMKSLTRQCSEKNVIYLDFYLTDTKSVHRKWYEA